MKTTNFSLLFKHFILVLFLSTGISFLSFAGEIRVNDGETKMTISSSSYQNITFTSTLSAIQYRQVQTSRGNFTELFVPGYGYGNSIGDPKLPVYRKILEVPLNASYNIQITRQQYKEFDLASLGLTDQIIPAQAPVPKNITDPNQIPFTYNASTYQLNQWSVEPLIKVTHIGILRSLNMGRLDISPIQYNPVTGKIRVYELLEVTVTYNGADVPSTIALKLNTSSPYFNNLCDLIPNYQSPSDSLITSSPVTYVIVSPETYQSTLQPFIKWKKKKGFKVIEAYTNNPNVGNTTTSIKNYLTGLYNDPPTGFNKPSFILFAGDVGQIPAWMPDGHPSDMSYCDYTNDNIPEVFYGRFSANDVTQLQAYIDKTIEYEQYTMPNAAFLGEVTMVAGADGSHQLTWGNGQINYGTQYYFNSAHNLISHTYLQPEPSGANYSQAIRNEVSNGVAYSNYTAHGSTDGWADPEFSISHIPALQNNHKFCMMVGNCCQTSDFSTTCFAEEVTRTPQKGALGYIGCSDNSYWDEDYWWGCGFKAVSTNPVYDPQHLGAYDVTFHDNGEPTSQWFVTMGQMVVGGNLAVEESSSSMKLYYWETYCLMGDPSLSVYFSVPPPVTASYVNTTMVGISTFTINTEPNAYVAMTINETTLLDAQCAGSSGIVNLSFPTINTPDTATIVITKQNRKPHIGTVNIIPANGPYLIYSTCTINDSTGNNNQKADYSEFIKLNVSVKNIGVQGTSNVTGTIESADTNIVIVNNTFNFGTIGAGSTITGNNAFSMKIKDKVDDQRIVSCTITFNDGTDTWTSTLILTLHAPVMTIGDVTVMDPAPGGNGNGVLDPGESATLKITIKNTGHSVAVNSISNLDPDPTSMPYILVSNPSYFLGPINPGTFGQVYAYFDVVVNGITPLGTDVFLNQQITAGHLNQYSAAKQIEIEIGQVPAFNMSNNTITTCNAKFFDSGGPASNYGDLESYTMTFSPGTPGGKVKAIFTSFDVEESTDCNYDWLKVYDGTNSFGELLGSFCGNTIPDPIVSSTGSLTFMFSSDYSDNFPGWTTEISCSGAPLTLLANAFPPDVCEGSSSQLVAVPSGGTENYTYLWTPSTYLDDPTSKTPISTPSDNISYTVTVNDGVNSLTSNAVTLTIHPAPATPVITEEDGVLFSSSSTGNQWYINGAMIPNANQPTYTPNVSGTFYAIVSDPATHCPSAPSNSITMIMTGMEDQSNSGLVSVYPNPASESFTISYELKNAGNVRITLSDAFGKECRIVTEQIKTSTGKHSILMHRHELAPGIYYLTVMTSDYRIVKKVLFTN